MNRDVHRVDLYLIGEVHIRLVRAVLCNRDHDFTRAGQLVVGRYTALVWRYIILSRLHGADFRGKLRLVMVHIVDGDVHGVDDRRGGLRLHRLGRHQGDVQPVGCHRLHLLILAEELHKRPFQRVPGVGHIVSGSRRSGLDGKAARVAGEQVAHGQAGIRGCLCFRADVQPEGVFIPGVGHRHRHFAHRRAVLARVVERNAHFLLRWGCQGQSLCQDQQHSQHGCQGFSQRVIQVLHHGPASSWFSTLLQFYYKM